MPLLSDSRGYSSRCSFVGLLVKDGQLGLVRVYDEDRQQLRRLCLAGICAHGMMIARNLRPIVAGVIGLLRPVVHLAADRTFEDRGIDECRFRMSMSR